MRSTLLVVLSVYHRMMWRVKVAADIRWLGERGNQKTLFLIRIKLLKTQWVVSHPLDDEALAHPIHINFYCEHWQGMFTNILDEALWLEPHTLHNRLKENTDNQVMFYLYEPVGVPWSPPRGGDVQVVARGGDGHLRLLVAIASSPRVGEAHGAEPWNIFRIDFFPSNLLCGWQDILLRTSAVRN